jgi:hypothetical protein
MTGEFNGLVILGVLWFILSRITSRGRSSSRGPSAKSPGTLPLGQLPGRAGGTQQEGLRLETLLRDLQRSMEQASSATRQGTLSNPSEARSLEEDVEPEAGRPVDLDDEAVEVEARRIQAAEARNQPQARARPAALEQVQAEPAEHTATRGHSAKQLRDAIVWQEILGPPVSER